MALQAYRGLAEVAIRCVCELLVALPHFNFHNNIIVMLVPLMNESSRKVTPTSLCVGVFLSCCIVIFNNLDGHVSFIGYNSVFNVVAWPNIPCFVIDTLVITQ